MSPSQIEQASLKTTHQTTWHMKYLARGWLQGSVFIPSGMQLSFDLDGGGLVVVSQSCSVVSVDFVKDPYVEVMGFKKLSAFRDRCPEATGRESA